MKGFSRPNANPINARATDVTIASFELGPTRWFGRSGSVRERIPDRDSPRGQSPSRSWPIRWWMGGSSRVETVEELPVGPRSIWGVAPTLNHS